MSGFQPDLNLASDLPNAHLSQSDVYATQIFRNVDPAIWTPFIPYLHQRHGGYKLAEKLKSDFRSEEIIVHGNDSRQFVWEQLGSFYMQHARFFEAIAIFNDLYEHLLLFQQNANQRAHKGMPLVYISDCFAYLQYPVHAIRYLMYALCEDAIRDRGQVQPNEGIYFRAVWHYGISEQLLNDYTARAYRLHNTLGELGQFPERLLAELDSEYLWMTDFPSEREYGRYWANSRYIEYLLTRLGSDDGVSLEWLGHYLISMIPGCRAYRRVFTPSTDYDVVGSFEGPVLDFRSDLGRYFLCECKDWELPADFATFAKFCRVLDSVKSRFGVLFSKKGISGQRKGRFADREQIKAFADRGIVIIVIDEADLRRVIKGESFLAILKSRYEMVRLDIASTNDSRQKARKPKPASAGPRKTASAKRSTRKPRKNTGK